MSGITAGLQPSAVPPTAPGNAAELREDGATTERTLLVSGLTLYVAWIVGTVVGVL